VKDTTWARIATDLVVVLVVAAQIAVGWRFGLIRRAFALVGTFAAAVAATFAGNPLAGVVRPNSTDADMVGFIAIFVAIILVVEILGALGSERLGGLAVVMFDRISGVVAGALLGVLQLGVVVLVTLSANAPAASTLAGVIRSATLGGAVVSIEPGIRDVMTPALPARLDTHLTAPPAS
jgi:uncharacterized membrane protein required for colicin V production